MQWWRCRIGQCAIARTTLVELRQLRNDLMVELQKQRSLTMELKEELAQATSDLVSTFTRLHEGVETEIKALSDAVSNTQGAELAAAVTDSIAKLRGVTDGAKSDVDSLAASISTPLPPPSPGGAPATGETGSGSASP